MTYRDEAIAAHESARAEEEAARVESEKALTRDARKAARPLFQRDGALLDPMPETTVLRVDLERRLVVFKVDDGSEVTFAVRAKGDETRVYLVKWQDGEPVRGPLVKTLEDVGEALADADDGEG